MATEIFTPKPSQPSSPSEHKNPYVLIVGAGVAGLFLAILLERAGIPYQVYERAKGVKPLGRQRHWFVSVHSIPMFILPLNLHQY